MSAAASQVEALGLFRTYHFLVVPVGVDEHELGQVEEILQANGAEVTLHTPGVDPSRFSIVVAATTDFGGYAAATAAMVPVVTPEFVLALYAQRRVVPSNRFSTAALPLHRVVVCVAPCVLARQRDATAAVVRAMGGQCLSQLTKNTTHLVSSSENDELVVVAEGYNTEKQNDQDYNETRIAIVGFQWLVDCFKQGREVDDTRYGLAAGASSPVAVVPLAQPPGTVYISTFQPFSADLVEAVRLVVAALGGRVAPSVDEALVVVCNLRDDPVYATVGARTVGTFEWMLASLRGTPRAATSLDCYPWVGKAVRPLAGCVVAISNYRGDGRVYLEQLVVALGGVFSKTLKPSNTHLVCPRVEGAKCEHAAKWGVPVVNHRWVEECYVAERRVNEEEYAVGAAEEPLGAARVKILKQRKRPRPGPDVVITLSPPRAETPPRSRPAIALSPPPLPSPSGGATPARDLSSQAEAASSLRDHSSQAEASTPARGRSAKLKAQAKIHVDMDAENYFQARKHNKNAPLFEEWQQKQLKHASSPPDAAPALRYILTGVAVELSPNETKRLAEVGVVAVDHLEQATALISPKPVRTEKFLCGLARVEHVLHPVFLQKAAAGDVDTEAYSLDARVPGEVKSVVGGLLLHEVIARRPAGGLFASHTLLVSKNLPGGTAPANILKAHGAEVVVTKKPGEPGEWSPGVRVLVAAKEDQRLVEGFGRACSKAGVRAVVVDWDWCVRSVFAMSVELPEGT